MTNGDIVIIMVKRFNQLLNEIQILNDKIDNLKENFSKIEKKISKLNEERYG